MQIIYNVKPIRGNYDPCKFTFGKTYNVIADYTKRRSEQVIKDNGYVVKNDLGENNMLFKEEVIVIDDSKNNTYIFDYK